MRRKKAMHLRHVPGWRRKEEEEMEKEEMVMRVIMVDIGHADDAG